MPDKFVIWSDTYDRIKEVYAELCDEDIYEDRTEDAMWDEAEELVCVEHENEINTLSQLKPAHPIVCVGTVSRWDGTHPILAVKRWDDMGEALWFSPKDCDETEYTVEFVCDEHKFLMRGWHHDGMYEVEFREMLDGDAQYESIEDAYKRTRPLGDDVAALYFPF